MITIIIFLLIICNVNAQNIIYNNNGNIGITYDNRVGYFMVDVNKTSFEIYNKLFIEDIVITPESSTVVFEENNSIKWHITKIIKWGVHMDKKAAIEYIVVMEIKDNEIKIKFHIIDVYDTPSNKAIRFKSKKINFHYMIHKKNGKYTKYGKKLEKSIVDVFNDKLQEIKGIVK